MSEKFYVQIDRTDDGSRTYKGPWVWEHCKRGPIGTGGLSSNTTGSSEHKKGDTYE